MRISDWSSDVCSSDLWQELVPERIDIGQAPAVESLIDPPGQHVDTVAPGCDIEQRDGIAAGLPSIELGSEGLPGPPVGVIGDEGCTADEVRSVDRRDGREVVSKSRLRVGPVTQK